MAPRRERAPWIGSGWNYSPDHVLAVDYPISLPGPHGEGNWQRNWCYSCNRIRLRQCVLKILQRTGDRRLLSHHSWTNLADKGKKSGCWQVMQNADVAAVSGRRTIPGHQQDGAIIRWGTTSFQYVESSGQGLDRGPCVRRRRSWVLPGNGHPGTNLWVMQQLTESAVAD